jgi:catechol 2,3-dioxygenase-like lactoylglutathione lyase family enzyme
MHAKGLGTCFVIMAALGFIAVGPPAKPPEALDVTATGAFAAFVVTDLSSSVAWYESVLGLHEIKRGRSPRVSAETVILGGHNFFIELAHYTDRTLVSRRIDDTNPVAGPVKTGAIMSARDFEALVTALRARGVTPGVLTDGRMNVRSFIIADNDGNLLQFFAPLS